jgi:thymidine kinase
MMTMNGLNVNKLESTGFAASLIEGQTLHSFFSINHLLRCTLQYDSLKWHIIKQTDVIIIDECSFISNELMNLIDDVLSRMYYDNKNNSKIICSKNNNYFTLIRSGFNI